MHRWICCDVAPIADFVGELTGAAARLVCWAGFDLLALEGGRCGQLVRPAVWTATVRRITVYSVQMLWRKRRRHPSDRPIINREMAQSLQRNYAQVQSTKVAFEFLCLLRCHARHLLAPVSTACWAPRSIEIGSSEIILGADPSSVALPEAQGDTRPRPGEIGVNEEVPNSSCTLSVLSERRWTSSEIRPSGNVVPDPALRPYATVWPPIRRWK
jgi:hypothetical protein